MISLQAQIEEVEREISIRKHVYPGWVRAGRMRQGEADQHLERMQAVLETLKRLEVSERLL